MFIFFLTNFWASSPSICANCLIFLLSKFVVGSSSARMPQSQKHSASARRMISEARTRWPALARPRIFKVAPSARRITTSKSKHKNSRKYKNAIESGFLFLFKIKCFIEIWLKNGNHEEIPAFVMMNTHFSMWKCTNYSQKFFWLQLTSALDRHFRHWQK